jgi:hypothetical protein
MWTVLIQIIVSGFKFRRAYNTSTDFAEFFTKGQLNKGITGFVVVISTGLI